MEPLGGPQGFSRYEVQLEEILIYPTAAGHRTVGNFVSFETIETDQDGNITKRTLASTSEEISYEWTDFESRRRYEVRLKTVESNQNGHLQEARYNVDGLRKRKLDKNGNSSKEFATGISTSASRPGNSSSAAPTISYISGHMILGAEIGDGTGSEFVFHLPDALGSTRDVVDSSGNVIRSFEHDEYGNLLSSWSSGTGAASPKTWIGGLSVNDDTADSGMFNMGHRNYAAGVLGRFISRDPIGHSGGLNLYAYPTAPVNAVDPSGLEPPLPTEVVLPDVSGDPSCSDSSKPFVGKAPQPTLLPITDPVFINNNNREIQGLDSVILARSFETNPPTRIDKLVGKVPNLKDLSWCGDCTYNGVPNSNNMCANFATAILTATQGLKMNNSAVDYISIPRILPALKAQGWHPVSRANAMPGDVWQSSGHIEIITTKGGTHSIGANTNPQTGYQYVFERPRSGGTIWTRRTIR